MSIQSEINRISTNIANAYDELETKGATMPQIENSDNLATTIASISSGGGEPGEYFSNAIGGFNPTSIAETILKIPQYTTIGRNMGGAFQGCAKITTIPLLDTSNVADMSNMFLGCTALTTIPLLNTSNVTSTGGMFQNCSSLNSVPLLNTSKATTMSYMFANCSSLTSIPQFNTQSATSYIGMFSGCTALTTIPLLNTANIANGGLIQTFLNCTSLNNNSLNNILAMCTAATKITKNKTLKYIGLSSAQATTCQSLSNWASFESAGWTTGY